MTTCDSHEIKERIDPMKGVGIRFKDGGVTYETLPDDRKPRHVMVKILSWAGYSLGAVHYYADISYHDLGEKVLAIPCGEKYRKVGQKCHIGGAFDLPKEAEGMTIHITKKVTKPVKHIRLTGPDTYDKVGSYTNCFDTRSEAIKMAKKEYNRIFGEGWVAMDGVSVEEFDFDAKLKDEDEDTEGLKAP